MGTGLAANLQDILKSLCGNESSTGALAFEQGISSDGRAMHDVHARQVGPQRRSPCSTARAGLSGVDRTL